MRVLAYPAYLLDDSAWGADHLSVFAILAVNSGLWGLAIAGLYRFIYARVT